MNVENRQIYENIYKNWMYTLVNGKIYVLVQTYPHINKMIGR